MPSPVDSQAVFGSAIRCPHYPAPSGLLDRHQNRAATRFNIYRNNHVVGLADALSKTFPVVQQLIGEQFFRSAAIEYVRRHPPASPVLLLYGDQFPDFLATLPGIAKVKYVVDVARLEWARIFSLNAADATPIPIQALSDIDPEILISIRFVMHPSLQVLSSDWPVLSIWRDCQQESGVKVNLSNHERLMLVRYGFEVSSWLLSAAEYAFIQTLFNGGTLGEAAEAATLIESDFNLAEQLALVFERGAIARISIN